MSPATSIPPSRRQVLRLGTGTAVLALPALLGACRDGTNGAQQATTTTGPAPEAALDGDELLAELRLLRTTASIELLMVDTYDRLLRRSRPDLGRLLRELLGRFGEHHREHADALREATIAGGGEPYDEANAVLQDRLVDPGFAAATSRPAVLDLVRDLEELAAAHDVGVVGSLRSPELRTTILAIGGAEARHVAALDGILASRVAPDAFLATTTAPSDDAAVD